MVVEVIYVSGLGENTFENINTCEFPYSMGTITCMGSFSSPNNFNNVVFKNLIGSCNPSPVSSGTCL